MTTFMHENNKDLVFAKELIRWHYSASNIHALQKHAPDSISTYNLERLLEVSSLFLEIAENTSDFKFAFKKFDTQTLSMQNLFKTLFCEQVYYLEHSDICENCEGRYMLANVNFTKNAGILCSNCFF